MDLDDDESHSQADTAPLSDQDPGSPGIVDLSGPPEIPIRASQQDPMGWSQAIASQPSDAGRPSGGGAFPDGIAGIAPAWGAAAPGATKQEPGLGQPSGLGMGLPDSPKRAPMPFQSSTAGLAEGEEEVVDLCSPTSSPQPKVASQPLPPLPAGRPVQRSSCGGAAAMPGVRSSQPCKSAAAHQNVSLGKPTAASASGTSAFADASAGGLAAMAAASRAAAVVGGSEATASRAAASSAAVAGGLGSSTGVRNGRVGSSLPPAGLPRKPSGASSSRCNPSQNVIGSQPSLNRTGSGQLPASQPSQALSR